MNDSGSKKQYLIALNKRRSTWALVASIVVSLATFSAVVVSVVENINAESSFHYFTTLSNLLSAIGALFMFPYAVEGIRKKRFSMPKWVCLFQYAGAVSVAITMFCAATIIAPTKGLSAAYGASSFWLHLVVPIMAIALFSTVESKHVLTKKDAVLAQIPFWSYSALYTVMVVFIGEDNGGWSDIYETTSVLPFPVIAVMLFTIGLAVALLLRFLHNRTIERYMQELSAQWSDDLTPTDLRIEAFGLGRYMAAHQDRNEILIPLDIFDMISEKHGVPVQDLVRAYTKGLLDKRAGR